MVHTPNMLSSHNIHTSTYNQNNGLYTSIIHIQKNMSSNANTKPPVLQSEHRLNQKKEVTDYKPKSSANPCASHYRPWYLNNAEASIFQQKDKNSNKHKIYNLKQTKGIK